MKDRHIGRVRCEVRLEREYMHVVLTAVCLHPKLERGVDRRSVSFGCSTRRERLTKRHPTEIQQPACRLQSSPPVYQFRVAVDRRRDFPNTLSQIWIISETWRLKKIRIIQVSLHCTYARGFETIDAFSFLRRNSRHSSSGYARSRRVPASLFLSRHDETRHDRPRSVRHTYGPSLSSLAQRRGS